MGSDGYPRDGCSLMAHRELILRLANLLDASLPLLERAARAEREREAGKSMRQTTQQHRFDSARKAVAEAFDLLGEEY